MQSYQDALRGGILFVFDESDRRSFYGLTREFTADEFAQHVKPLFVGQEVLERAMASGYVNPVSERLDEHLQAALRVAGCYRPGFDANGAPV
jgi:hypothetical protein